MSYVVRHVRGVLRTPSRLVLTGLAITMGAFFAMASVLTHDIAERTALANVTRIPSGVDYVVEGVAGNQAAALQEIRRTRGVQEATGRTVVPVVVRGRHLKLTADPGSGPLSRVRLTSGSYPSGAGEIAASPAAGLSRGSRVRIGSRTVTVSGTVAAPSLDGAAVYTTDDGVLGLVSARFTRIDIAAQGPVDVVGVLDADTARSEALAAADSGITPLLAILTAFVVVSAIGAVLVATSTFRIVFAQRRRQSALLRAIGAPRRRLVRSLLAEGALTGLLASALGTLVAVALGRLAPVLLDVSAPRVSPVAPVLVVVVATCVTAVSALAPARSSARVSPLDALRTGDTGLESSSGGRSRVVLGALLLLLAAAVVVKMFGDGLAEEYRPDNLVQDLMLETVASGTLVFLALVALAPVALAPFVRRLERPLARLGPAVRLAVRGIAVAPRRAATVISVVALGTTLLTAVLVGGETVRDANDAEMAAAYPADVSVTANAEDEPLPADLVPDLRREPGVTGVIPYRTVRQDLTAPHTKINLEVSDLAVDALPGRERLGLVAGSLADLGPGRIVVTDQQADVARLTVGMTVRIGALRERVAAVVVGSQIGRTGLVLDARDLSRLGAPSRPTDVLVTAPTALGRIGAQQVVRDRAQVTVTADERAAGADFVRLLEVVAVAVLALTVLISVIGVGATVSLSVVERRKEHGMLRAIGLTRRALAGTTLCEAVLYGVLGGLCGLVIGIPHAWFAIRALGPAEPLSVPVAALAGTALALVALTMAAGLLPARRAARTSPVDAMRAE